MVFCSTHKNGFQFCEFIQSSFIFLSISFPFPSIVFFFDLVNHVERTYNEFILEVNRQTFFRGLRSRKTLWIKYRFYLKQHQVQVVARIQLVKNEASMTCDCICVAFILSSIAMHFTSHALNMARTRTNV